ncbi:MAG: phosphoadenylyl-sulfate reductase [Elusimicrobiota bacterium]
MNYTIDAALVNELGRFAEPGALLAELHRRFGDRLAIGTSGQLTGTALIDMAVAAGFKPRVFTNDTYRLFPETYALFDQIEKKYGLRIERFTPEVEELEDMVAQHGEHLFFDSKEKQELCCRVRKVLPNERALDTLDAWVTGLRADQSAARAATPRLQIIQHGPEGAKRPILKAAPLVDWTEQRLRDYIKSRNVPVHRLLNKKMAGGYYYESLGCVLCTTPIGPHEPRRAGRWRWFNAVDDNKECGLHQPAADDK